jgi:hypothetical protein
MGVPAQIDVYTYVNGDVEMPFFDMTTWYCHVGHEAYGREQGHYQNKGI